MVHESGRVISKMSSQLGTVDMTLNGFGSLPDLYRERREPILQMQSVGGPKIDYSLM